MNLDNLIWSDVEQRFITIPDGNIATHYEIKKYYEQRIKECKDHSKWDTCRVEKMGCNGCHYYK